MKRFLAVASLGVILACSGANAAQIIDRVSISTQSGQFSVDPMLPQFDPSLGTLDWVNLYIDIQFSGTADQPVTALGPYHYGMQGATTLTDSSLVDLKSQFGQNRTAICSWDYSCPSTLHFSYSASAAKSTGRLYASQGYDLSEFIGFGDVPLVFRGYTDVFGDHPGTYGSVGVSAELSAYYDYTPAVQPPAPEPATWALMLTGIGVLGAGLRRRTPRQAA